MFGSVFGREDIIPALWLHPLEQPLPVMMVPLAGGVLILLQGIAEATRCVICIRTGEWPPRLHDVQETETMLMHEREDLEKSEQHRD